jgi:hypothetical protein
MRYVEAWKKHNIKSAIGCRQSGMSYLAYILEHPKARGLVFTRKGELNKRYHRIKTTVRGRIG